MKGVGVQKNNPKLKLCKKVLQMLTMKSGKIPSNPRAVYPFIANPRWPP
jgi:hypothetical protein